MLPAILRPWFWVGLWLVFLIVSIAIFAGFHTRIFEMLETMATFIKGLGQAGPLIIMLGLFLTSFPPLVGYSSLVTMSGYVYGFWFGLLIAYSSALLGSITCFYLCRKWFKVQVRALMAKKQSMKSVVKAVEKRGFKLMLLIRLAPYPFNVMNALLSATHIPLSTFAIATAISLTKLALHVYIGSTLSSLAILPPPPTDTNGPNNDDGSTPLPTDDANSHGRNLKIVVMAISMVLGIAVGAYVWIVAKREIEASEGVRIERRRKRRESLRQSRGSKRSSSGGVAAGRGSGRVSNVAVASNSSYLLARGGSSERFDLLGQDNSDAGVSVVDLPLGSGSGSDFVGDAFVNHEYLDDDETGQEDQALVGGNGAQMHNRRHSLSGTAAMAGRIDYCSDSEESDFLDDEDEDMSDMERGVGDGGESFQLHATGMDIRSPQPSPSHPLRNSRGTGQESMGWFAENGIDISDGR
ncbi:hypothetical protein BGZ54_002452 [Gamsiella multidivaricata]|nr:hypothetical protein BGZ54_002452 [Gamsiella multidivaricata]